MGFVRKPEQIEMARERWNSSKEEDTVDLEWNQLEAFVRENTNTVFIDLQEDLEQEQIHGVSVKHIPDYVFMDEIQQIDKNQTVVVFCKRGVKSRWALEVMKSLGFKNRYQLSGGMASVTE